MNIQLKINLREITCTNKTTSHHRMPIKTTNSMKPRNLHPHIKSQHIIIIIIIIGALKTHLFTVDWSCGSPRRLWLVISTDELRRRLQIEWLIDWLPIILINHDILHENVSVYFHQQADEAGEQCNQINYTWNARSRRNTVWFSTYTSHW